MTTIVRLLEQLDDMGEKKIWEGGSSTIHNLEIAKSSAIDGLNVIGDLLAEVGIACGRAGCEPIEVIQRDTLWRVGSLIQELADVAKWCDEVEGSIHAQRESKTAGSRFGNINS